ncbi:probable ergosterol biosynthetic protein 28 isoform X2 [Limulus polyphemus]|uniref:Probable ergosterol biosynthetic protein 28 isoform X2 n=1 Tax=Limulus polyphemus TaxID=6850 RepID=A0ABM1TGV0_LIMPO|nr:probable ergosterol biosynthetic protein 28 isoform X2 [Limulus polyphemus]
MGAWMVNTLRGWLAFLSFMHFGTASRCFTDESFLQAKLYIVNIALKGGGFEMDRIFGFWSLTNAIIFLYAAVFIHNLPVMSLSGLMVVVYLFYFMIETFLYKSISISGAGLYPVTVSAMTLVWMGLSYKSMKEGSYYQDDADENEELRRKMPFSKPTKKTR